MFTSVWRHLLLPSTGVCQKLLTVHSQNRESGVWVERTSADLSVVITKTLLLPLYLEGDAHLDPIWTLGSAVYCWDCKVFCPMSHIHPVTARPAPQLQISCQNFATFPICVKMFHPLCYFLAKVIHVESVRSQICVGLYIHIFFTK
jgi:hypothetical protein